MTRKILSLLFVLMILVLPFGGRISNVLFCCNGLTIAVGPPRPGVFLFTFGSILHAYYNIFQPGPWVLGLANPGGVCLTLPFCFPMPVEGTIVRVGTSGL